ncbi:Transcriptional regulator WAR1 [Bienertia sinuspersici]
MCNLKLFFRLSQKLEKKHHFGKKQHHPKQKLLSPQTETKGSRNRS